MKLIDRIKRNEGYKKGKNGRFVLYKCTAGKLTCGYGRNAEDNGFSQDEVDLMLQNDIANATQDLLQIFPDLLDYGEARKNALIDMVFNLGRTRFLKFKLMIAAIKAGDWSEAARQAMDSRWARQVGGRAKRDCTLLLTGG